MSRRTGGQTKPIPGYKIKENPEAQRIDQIVRNLVPQVRTSKLIQYTTQVVGGILYRFHYASQIKAIKVWSRPWENDFLQITLPDGTVINNPTNDNQRKAPGTPSDPIPGSQIEEDADAKRADDFVRENVPQVRQSRLIEYTTQVVAGTLYFFVYEGYNGEIKVWSKPWNHGFLQITLPNGTVINNLLKEPRRPPGGQSGPIPGEKINEDPDAKRSDDFVREHVPEVTDAKLISYTNQVVAGVLYRFTYEGYQGEIEVWSKPWQDGFLQATLPNGIVFDNLYHTQENLSVGPIPGACLDADARRASLFVREKVPQVRFARLISHSYDIISGRLYHFTYEGYEGDIKVWSKPWEKGFLQITLPNGTVISNQKKFIGGQSHPIPGGFIEGDAKRASDFVREKVPKVRNSILVSYTTQVVAGTLYTFHYLGYSAAIKVWSKPWENGFLQITLPNGTVISNQKKPVGAQSDPILGENIHEEDKRAEDFVREKVPDVSNSKLLSYTTQIVAGLLYRFTYQGYEGVIEVLSQEWNHGFLQITLPDGTEISNQ